MRSTGIVRRIDDLGRIVIPKEIRRSLNIREGDPLEIFVDKNTICFQKYRILNSVFGEDYFRTLTAIYGKCVVSDTDDYIVYDKYAHLIEQMKKYEIKANGELIGYIYLLNDNIDTNLASKIANALS